MELYLIRHGETNWNKERRFQGRSDIPLNEKGEELAFVTAEALKDVPFTHIFSSPLIRARRTAEIIKGSRSLPIVTDERLTEMGFGIIEGVPSSTITDILEKFFKAPEAYEAPEGGETYEEVCARTRDFMEKVIIPLSKKEPEAKVLLAGHGALIKTIYIYLKHLEIKNMWDGEFLQNCSVTIFDIDGHDFKEIQYAKIYY